MMIRVIAMLGLVIVPCQGALAAPGEVLGLVKISNLEGGFDGVLDDQDRLGRGLARIGDVDQDGVDDLVAGAIFDDDGGRDRGAVWVLFMNADGTVKAKQKISDTEGGFTGALADDDELGIAIVGLGDHDGDGVPDLAVTSWLDDDGGQNRGAVWILFLNGDGTVQSHQKISDTQGGFTGVLDNSDFFGVDLASLGDLNGDGIGDLAVNAFGDDDGGVERGAVWILFLNADGTVNGHQKISDTEGGFMGALDNEDGFGSGLAWDPATSSLAVGATLDDDGGLNRGAVWILDLNTDGTVAAGQKISDTAGGFTGTLTNDERWGQSAAWLGDVDGDCVNDLAVGSRANDGGLQRGAVWILFMNADHTVKAHQKISNTEGQFTGELDDQDQFGQTLAAVPGLDDPLALAAGAWLDDDGGLDRGAIWVLQLEVACAGDADGDGEVGVVDLLERLEQWGPCAGGCSADFDCDETVSVIDLLVLLGAWGPCN